MRPNVCSIATRAVIALLLISLTMSAQQKSIAHELRVIHAAHQPLQADRFATERPQQSYQVEKKHGGKKFDIHQFEREEKTFKSIVRDRQIMKKMRRPATKNGKVQAMPQLTRVRQGERVMLLGKPTRFLQAPRIERPNLAALSRSSISNALINGKSHDTVFVSDPITLTFTFAPNAVSAVVNVYLDVDGNGVVSDGDIPMASNMLMLDNDDNDQDSSVGAYTVTFGAADFLNQFVSSLIFEVNDFQSVSSATVTIRQHQTSSILTGTVSPAFPFVLITGNGVGFVLTDSSGRFSSYIDRSRTSIVMLSTFDITVTGETNGYIAPPPKSVNISSDTTTVNIAFAPATAFIDGYARDQFGTAIPKVLVGAFSSLQYVRTQADSLGYYKLGVDTGYVNIYSTILWSSDYLRSNSPSWSTVMNNNTTVHHDIVFTKSNTTISGRVTLNASGLAGIPIYAYTDSLSNSAFSASDGNYSIPVYSPSIGTKLYYVDTYVPRGYYAAIPFLTNVQPGASGVNFEVKKVAGGIEGRITDVRTGVPIQGASINASGPDFGYAASNDSGYYRMSLLDGVYSLSVYANQYLPYSESNILIAGAVVTKNISLTKSGSFSGTIKDIDGKPVPYSLVTAIDTAGIYFGSGFSDTAGNYVVSGLRTSRYIAQNTTQGYVTQWYDKANVRQNATLFQVTEGFETPNINFVLSRGGSIMGRVVDLLANPLSGVEIDVLDTLFRYVSFATTNDSGYYQASGLETGQYYVGAFSAIYANQWFDGAYNLSGAKKVEVAIDHETPNINFKLSRGASISGHVKNKAGAGISYAFVSVLDSAYSYVSYTSANDSGYYTIGQLAAGVKYYVLASSYSYARRWYNNVSSPDSATPIILAPEENRTNIDFILTLAGKISGRVLDDAGTPLPYASVNAEDSSGNVYGYGYPDQQGNYAISTLSTGTYYITAWNYGYAPQWYDHKANQELADKVNVIDEMETPNINFNLQNPTIALGPKFSEFVNRVTLAPYGNQSAIVDSFVAAVPSFPYIESDTIACFLFRGSASNVNVPGDANNWDVTAWPMHKLSSTDLWYYSRSFESDARLEYKFYQDGNWILDPRNPKQVTSTYGPNSELQMPKYVPPPEVEYYADIPHGQLKDSTFYSTNLGNSRTIRVYTPPGYNSAAADSFPVVVFHDGLEYISLAFANNVLDYLIAKKLISPIIGVFVPPVNRDPEYIGNQQDQLAAFVASELMPYIDSHYRTIRNPRSRATVGISNGGNIALWICYKYPQEFGNAGSFSGNIQPSTTAAYETSSLLPIQMYVDFGTYEPYIQGVSQTFIDTAQQKGYSVKYSEWHQGHNWGNWRAHLHNALEYFFPGTALGVAKAQSVPTNFRLLQNFPNPFNPYTTIRFDVPVKSRVKLMVFNIIGQLVQEIMNEEVTAGYYEKKWNGGVASGIYFCRIEATAVDDPGRRFVDVKKMLLLK